MHLLEDDEGMYCVIMHVDKPVAKEHWKTAAHAVRIDDDMRKDGFKPMTDPAAGS